MAMEDNSKNSQGTARFSAAFLFAISAAFFWSHVIPHESGFSFLAALLVCCIGVFVIVFLKYDVLCSTIKKVPSLAVLACLLAAFFSWGSYSIAGHSMSLLSIPYGAKLFYVLGYPAGSLLFYCLISVVKMWALDLWARLDVLDKRIGIVASAVLFVLMLYFVTADSSWYMQYDMVCSLDSGYVLQNIFQDISYYDIRHPVLSLFTFPVWCTLVGIAKVFVPAQIAYVFCVVGVQVISIAFLVSCGAMLKAMSCSRTCYVLYLAAFPTLLFSVAVEKYVITLFIIVLTVYLCMFHRRYRPIGYALAIGVMPTNIFLLLVEFVLPGSAKEKILRVALAVLAVIVVIAISGHMSLLNPLEALNQVHSTHEHFGRGDTPIYGRFFAWINMIQGSLMPMTLDVTSKGEYMWPALTSKVGVLGFVILAFMVLGLIRGRKLFTVRAACIWVVFSAVLFVVFNWSPDESVLFASIFYWAVVLLFDQGWRFVNTKLGPNVLKVATAAVVVLLLVLGVLELASIADFMREFL